MATIKLVKQIYEVYPEMTKKEREIQYVFSNNTFQPTFLDDETNINKNKMRTYYKKNKGNGVYKHFAPGKAGKIHVNPTKTGKRTARLQKERNIIKTQKMKFGGRMLANEHGRRKKK